MSNHYEEWEESREDFDKRWDEKERVEKQIFEDKITPIIEKVLRKYKLIE